MDDREIIEIWERLCAAADDSAISDAEHERRMAAVRAFATTTPHHLRVIYDEYARKFPDGPPPGTPGMTDQQRKPIADRLARRRQGDLLDAERKRK